MVDSQSLNKLERVEYVTEVLQRCVRQCRHSQLYTEKIDVSGVIISYFVIEEGITRTC